MTPMTADAVGHLKTLTEQAVAIAKERAWAWADATGETSAPSETARWAITESDDRIYAAIRADWTEFWNYGGHEEVSIEIPLPVLALSDGDFADAMALRKAERVRVAAERAAETAAREAAVTEARERAEFERLAAKFAAPAGEPA